MIKYPDNYFNKILEDEEIIYYVREHDNRAMQWKIALPKQLIPKTIKWFHQVLGHLGSKRMLLPLKACYYHPNMRAQIENYNCDTCQRHKLQGKGYGLLPEWENKQNAVG